MVASSERAIRTTALRDSVDGMSPRIDTAEASVKSVFDHLRGIQASVLHKVNSLRGLPDARPGGEGEGEGAVDGEGDVDVIVRLAEQMSDLFGEIKDAWGALEGLDMDTPLGEGSVDPAPAGPATPVVLKRAREAPAGEIFACDKCSKSYGTQRDLSNHKYNSHRSLQQMAERNFKAKLRRDAKKTLRLAAVRSGETTEEEDEPEDDDDDDGGA